MVGSVLVGMIEGAVKFGHLMHARADLLTKKKHSSTEGRVPVTACASPPKLPLPCRSTKRADSSNTRLGSQLEKMQRSEFLAPLCLTLCQGNVARHLER